MKGMIKLSITLDNDYQVNKISEVYNNRQVAENLLSKMQDWLNDYGTITIYDYKSMIGKEGSYQDTNYGWTNLREAVVRKTKLGYRISFPTLKKLN
jgi:hypothetical protein